MDIKGGGGDYFSLLWLVHWFIDEDQCQRQANKVLVATSCCMFPILL